MALFVITPQIASIQCQHGQSSPLSACSKRTASARTPSCSLLPALELQSHPPLTCICVAFTGGSGAYDSSHLVQPQTRLSRQSWGGSSIAASASNGSTDKNELFKDAAKGGDLELVEELVASREVKIDLPSQERAGWTALQLASFYGHKEVVRTLLKAGAETEVRNESGNTALQLACLKGNIEIARMLLESGADIQAQSDDKGTPLDYANEWGGEQMVSFLQMWAARANAR